MTFRILAAGLSATLIACAGPQVGATVIQGDREAAARVEFGEVSLPTAAALSQIESVLDDADVYTAAIGVIRGGVLVSEAIYGERAPGEPATRHTRFDVASITKTVVAETVLRLSGEGLIDLDEPMAAYWVDPDITDDPRTQILTPRHVLTHSTGFPNWRFFRADGRLAFEHDPGETYTYSGEGFEYLTRFIEAKLGRPFPELAREYVLEPLSMTDTALVKDQAAYAHLAEARDADGTFYGHFCRPPSQGGACAEPGSYMASAEMTTTVGDYARFLGSVLREDGYGPRLATERDTIQTPETGDDAIVRCTPLEHTPCPNAQGYGLGFEILDYVDETVIGHGGYDWAQLAIAYVYKSSGDGVIVFLNAPNAQARRAMPGVLAALDPQSPFRAQFERWRPEPEDAESASE